MSTATASRVDWALRYAALGWRVFPCHWIVNGGCSCGDEECSRPGKHPLGWREAAPHGLKDATTDPDRLRYWFTRWAAANMAIATGPESGVWVLDADGAEGVRQFGLMCEAHGALPPHPLARTGGGGQHHFFPWPADGQAIGNRQRHGGFPIDVRGAGGYVLVEPSVNLKGVYAWETAPWDLKGGA